MDLDGLKKVYAEVSEKNKLPGFAEMNEYFEIEKIDKDTDYLLREIRKHMMEKVVGYIRFLEIMVYPSQTPPMFLVFIKNMTTEDREIIQKLYKNLVELELKALRLEVQSSDKEESEMIKKILETWKSSKKNMLYVIDMMEKSWSSSEIKKEKAYFG